MEEVISYISENQMLFYVIGVSLVLAIILLLAIQLVSKKPEKEELEDTMEDFSNKKKEVLEELEHLEESSPIKEEPIVNQEEIKVTPIEVYQQETPTSEIDLLLTQMKKDIQEHKDPIESFEEFQEENAIISYEELKKANQKESIMSAEEEESQPIIMSVRELERRNQKEEIKETTPVKETKGKFKNTEFISPIYGKISSDALEYPKIPSFKKEEKQEEKEESELFQTSTKTEDSLYNEPISSKTVNTVEVEEPDFLDELTEEMKRNEEFLQALKEFRKNL